MKCNLFSELTNPSYSYSEWLERTVVSYLEARKRAGVLQMFLTEFKSSRSSMLNSPFSSKVFLMSR